MEVVKEKYKMLKFIQFNSLDIWSYAFLVGKKSTYKESFEKIIIADILQKSKNIVQIEDSIFYDRVTVKINCNGVVKRDTEQGLNIGTKKQFRVKEGQFIVSKIDARNGAFGIIPAELDGAIVTNDFPVFDINTQVILPAFFFLLSSTREFVNFAKSCSSGTTNRQRMDMDLFMKQEIPLPTLAEQQKIVDAYQAKIQQAQALQTQANHLEVEIERCFLEQLGIEKEREIKHNSLLKFIEYVDFDRWDGKSEKKFSSIYNIERIGKYITEISTGTTPPTGRDEYFNGEINFYAPSDLGKEMYLKEAERKVTELAIKDKKARKFEKDTLLFVGIGSTVGKIGIVANDYATSNQQITGFKVDNSNLLNEFVYYYFNLCKHITVKEQTKATIPIVNQDKIVNIQIPVPPISIQKRIYETINAMKNDVELNKFQSAELRSKAQQEFEKQIFG